MLICSITAPGLVALCITPPRRCSDHFSHMCKCPVTHHPDLVETRRHPGLGGHKGYFSSYRSSLCPVKRQWRRHERGRGPNTRGWWRTVAGMGGGPRACQWKWAVGGFASHFLGKAYEVLGIIGPAKEKRHQQQRGGGGKGVQMAAAKKG